MKKETMRFFALIILGLFMFAFLAMVANAANPPAAPPATPVDAEKDVTQFFEKKPVKYVIGIVFGLWSLDNVSNEFVGGASLVRNNVGAIIAYLALWIALLLAFGNIVGMFNITSEWVGWVFGIALTIAAAQLKFVFWLISLFAILTAWLGTISVFGTVIMSFVAAFLLSIGTERLRIWATHRKLAIEQVKSMKGTARATTGIKGLGEIAGALEKAGNR